ncbi:MAG: threonine synthase [Chloroflexi bacterium]|jgi:threonine synthase|nr:threonine synthase [Chloroflexota bacterium]
MSYLHHLECSACGESIDPAILQTFCQNCQAPLLVRYDLEKMRAKVDRDAITHRPKGMWRWREILPVLAQENMLFLGEGDTPLLQLNTSGAKLGLSQLYVKDESINPTGTFKARGLAAAVSKAKELGVTKVIIPTAGNAGGAMAAYAARGGMQAHIFMPADTPYANQYESQIVGASIELVDGLISDAARLAHEKAVAEGWFDVSTFKEPYRTEGKKIMGYELAEQFGWTLPDVIIYPTGGGTGLVGMWKAFDEMEALGWLESSQRPRMVAVQAAGCAPIIKAFDDGATSSEFWNGAQTVAAGLRVPKSFADKIILDDLRASHGTAIAVSDEQLLAAQRFLASREGIFAAPEGAATLAGLIQLKEKGWVAPDERVVLFNTGTGLKYIPAG